jgi:hypothetical protein
MGIFDKAKDLVNKNQDKVDDAVDKAAAVVKKKTGGKYDAQVDKAEAAIKDKTGNL